MALPIVHGYELTSSDETAASFTVDFVDARIPPSVAASELLLMFVSNDENGSADPSIIQPTGFTPLVRAGSGTNDIRVAIFGKVAVGNEGGATVRVESVTKPGDTFLVWVFRISNWSGNLNDIVLGAPSDPAATGSSVIAASLTTLVDECLVFAIGAGDGSDMLPTGVTGTGWDTATTQITQTNPAGGGGLGSGVALAYKAVNTAGPSSDATIAMGSNDGVAAVQVAVPPNGGGPPPPVSAGIKLGSAPISKIQFGTLGIGKIYLGSLLMFNNASPTNHANHGGGGGGTPPPTSTDGMWISANELSTFPTSGSAWSNVLAAADTFSAVDIDYTNQNSTDGVYAMASAIVFARTGTASYRTKVASAINSIANAPYNKTANPTALGWARNMTSWCIAAELIDLSAHNSTLHAQFQSFLAGMPDEPYSGDGGIHLRELSTKRPNNIGAFARCAMVSIAKYTGNTAMLSEYADRHREWVEGENVYSFSWGSDQSWQENPGTPSTWKGVVPAGVVRDGHNFDGIIPDDYRRNGVYNPSNFPGPSVTDYPLEVIDAVIVTVEMLRRSGHPAAPSWGNNHVERMWVRYKYLSDNHSADGWAYPTGNDQWLPFAVNRLYSRTDPTTASPGPGRPVAWTDFTHQTP